MGEFEVVLSELKRLRCKSDGDVYIADLDPIARRHKKNHDLACSLWDSGSLAARLLATRIVDVSQVTENLLDEWVEGLGGWGLCDAFTAGVVRPSKWAVTKCHEWAARESEYERRAAFSTMAQLAWQKNEHRNDVFIGFLPLVEKFSNDHRFYVKKAVNWALRDIGKRNSVLLLHAQKTARKLQESDDKTARWIGRHRMKEIGLGL